MLRYRSSIYKSLEDSLSSFDLPNIIPCLMGLALFLFTIVFYGWLKTIRAEAVVFGKHNLKVRKGLMLGFKLFILSEIAFFASIFWAYIYNSVNPSPSIGWQWPPLGIIEMNHMGVPLFESVLLFSSWFTIDVVLYALSVEKNLEAAKDWLLITIMFGVIFLYAQLGEYINYRYAITDGIFGSVFYLGTGFHGFHVLVGIVFLTITLIRLQLGDFTPSKMLGCSFSIMYWHFVDAVWIGLFFVFYFSF